MANVETSAAGSDMCTVLRPAMGTLEKARWMTMKLAEELTEDQLFARPCAEGNHGVWVLGHIAHTDDAFMMMVGGKTRGVPESWDGLFGMNSKVDDDRAKYPSRDELFAALSDRREAFKAWVGSLSEAELLAPIEGELAQFAATRAEMVSSLAFHEAFHAGQLSMARRACGMAPQF